MGGSNERGSAKKMRIGNKVVNDKIIKSIVERLDADQCDNEYVALHTCLSARQPDTCLGLYTKFMICMNRATDYFKKNEYTAFGSEFGKFSARHR